MSLQKFMVGIELEMKLNFTQSHLTMFIHKNIQVMFVIAACKTVNPTRNEAQV